MKKIAFIREIEPVESVCITVDSDRKLFKSGGGNINENQDVLTSVSTMAASVGAVSAMETMSTLSTQENKYSTTKEIISGEGLDTGSAFVTHNSVLQRSIVFACILRPESWAFVGVDLKKVELTPYVIYKNVVMGVATTLENALEVLRFAQQTMMKRYEMMTVLGVKNFLDLPEKGRALMVMVDEYGEAASPTGTKTDEGKADDAMKGEIQMLVGSIARLGRAAGVHLAVATQRPDAKMLPGETKFLDIKTPIITGQCVKTMEEIELGDEIFDENGTRANVVNMTETMYGNKVYKINFTSAIDPIIAGAPHKWPVKTAYQRLERREIIEHFERFPDHKVLLENLDKINVKKHPMISMREFENIVGIEGKRVYIFRKMVQKKELVPVKTIPGEKGRFPVSYYDTQEVIEKMTAKLTRNYAREGAVYNPELMTTEQMYEKLKDYGDRKLALDVNRPLDFKHRDDLLVEPWLLGFWLGDGSRNSGTYTTADNELIEKIRDFGYETKRVKNSKHGCTTKGLAPKLKAEGVLPDKHIPEKYLYSSIEQRRALLAGLLDSDGTAARKQASFVNTNKNLAEGVLFLVRSLGFKASMVKKDGIDNPFKDSPNFGKKTQDFYRVTFTTNEPVFTLARKNAALELNDNDRKTQEFHYIESIEPVDTVPTKCIEVDNDSHTYLAGLGLVPTHNSNLGCRINCGYTDSTASSMILDDTSGTKVKPNPKGRFYIKIYSLGNHGQAFFAQEDWMDKYLESQGLNSDGTPKGSSGADNSNNSMSDGVELNLHEATSSNYSRPEEDWDDELDSLIEENQD